MSEVSPSAEVRSCRATRANLTSLVHSTNFTETGFPEAKHELLGFAVQLHFCDSKNFTNKKERTLRIIKPFCPLFFYLYMVLGLAQVRLTCQMRCSHSAEVSNSPLRASRISMPLFDFIYDYAKMQERAPRAARISREKRRLRPKAYKCTTRVQQTAVVNKNNKNGRKPQVFNINTLQLST